MNLEEIIKKCKGEVCLRVNEHRNMYMTVEQKIKEVNEIDFGANGDHEDYEPEIDQELAKRLINADVFYELQFYPHTPIGFYTVYGVSLDEVVKKANNILKDEF